jgi:hypothetical protein
MISYQTIILGCIGGALPDVLRLIAGRHGEVPKYVGSPYFWISLVVLVALGGGTTYLYSLISPQTLSGSEPGPGQLISALAIGYSAPSLISKLLSEPAATATRGVDRGLHPTRSLRGWWAS